MAGKAVMRTRLVLTAAFISAVVAGVSSQSRTADGVAALARGDYQQAIEILRPIAEDWRSQDTVAQFFLAGLYASGRGVAADPVRACALYARAGSQSERPFGRQAMPLFAAFMSRGQEFNAWGRPTNPPEHLSILPFTRLLAGPMDFTPGIFDITFGKTNVNERVQSTLAAQLAEYVLIYSPVQMAADLPENYEQRLDALQFIKDVPTDWESSRTLRSEIGDYVVVARQQRGLPDWYLGAATDENARTLVIPLDFLAQGRRYEAQIYRDGPGASYLDNPTALVIEKRRVTAGDRIEAALAPGGGLAVRFKAL